MSEKKWLPPSSAFVTPYLSVRDPQASIKFYQEAFGFETGTVMPGPGGKPMHVDMSYHGKSVVMFSPEDAPWGDKMQAPATSGAAEPVGFYLYCEDVDAMYERAIAAGATPAYSGDNSGPQDMFWGDRIGTLCDPDGYRWTLATKVGEFDPDKVPKFD